LVVGLVSARGDHDRLAVRLGDELRRSNVGNPDLEGAQPLATQAFAVLAYSVPS
jgi:hypothetical protein